MMANRSNSNTPLEHDQTSNLNQNENENETSTNQRQNREPRNQTLSGDLRNRHGGTRANHANRETIQELEHQQQEEEESTI